MSVTSGTRQQTSPEAVKGQVVTDAASKLVVAQKRKSKWEELGWALIYMTPALAVFITFTFVPFFRAIWLSFFVTDPKGDTARFNDVKYYSRILNLDGSGRDEYLKSIVTTVQFSLMTVPLGIIAAVGLAVLATAKVFALSLPVASRFRLPARALFGP